MEVERNQENWNLMKLLEVPYVAFFIFRFILFRSSRKFIHSMHSFLGFGELCKMECISTKIKKMLNEEGHLCQSLWAAQCSSFFQENTSNPNRKWKQVFRSSSAHSKVILFRNRFPSLKRHRSSSSSDFSIKRGRFTDK